MNFQTSTQKKSWTFTSPNELAERRHAQRKKALDVLLLSSSSSLKKKEFDVEEEENENDEKLKMMMEKEFSFPTAKEEEIYRKRLEAKIDPLCSAFNLPVKVTHCATTLFKRYCLANPIVLTNLKIVMVASVYLACKVEESYVSAEQLCKVVKDIDYNKVLNAELAVLQGGFSVDFVRRVSALNGFAGCDSYRE